MKSTKPLLFIIVLLISLPLNILAQGSKKLEGPLWRFGIGYSYATNFKNVRIDYSSMGIPYTGLLGGYTGRGGEVFLGRKVHKYLVVELTGGFLFNSYNRAYDPTIYIIGRFNKIYVHPGVKFIYPILEKDFGTINLFLSGGIGLNGSGRFYLEERDYSDKYITYARYNPMIAPFASFGAELLLGEYSNIQIGLKYLNGAFEAKQYYESYNPSANLNNMPAELKMLQAQGIGFMLGFIKEF